MALTLDQIVQLYRTAGAERYGMEAISQEQHALQCALLAEEAGAAETLVAAALLHDLGHLLSQGLPGSATAKDDLHEYRALPFLRGEFPDAVLEPVRLHVAAKRWLCASEPAYARGLSPASVRSLQLQGGPFTPAEAQAFMAQSHAADALALRRWDDQAKSPTRSTPGWDHWRALLARVQCRRPQRLAA